MDSLQECPPFQPALTEPVASCHRVVQLGADNAELQEGSGRLQADLDAAVAELASMKSRQAELKAELVSWGRADVGCCAAPVIMGQRVSATGEVCQVGIVGGATRGTGEDQEGYSTRAK